MGPLKGHGSTLLTPSAKSGANFLLYDDDVGFWVVGSSLNQWSHGIVVYEGLPSEAEVHDYVNTLLVPNLIRSARKCPRH